MLKNTIRIENLEDILRELFEELPYTLFDNAESFIKKQLDKLGKGDKE